MPPRTEREEARALNIEKEEEKNKTSRRERSDNEKGLDERTSRRDAACSIVVVVLFWETGPGEQGNCSQGNDEEKPGPIDDDPTIFAV